ncbi:hypothetical protein [Humibacter sp. RRB41]|uniref:hypothetical protein n=1 Tax=Humibacter sp. RRB41 TaxID=2919946 RepID=UPI001FAAFD31|nr:hypothetical protein [Humibacter sp. RRB41]
MSEWPDRLDVGPIREWPGELTPQSRKKVAPFKTSEFDSYRRRSVPLWSTLELLDRELRMLGATNQVMLVAISPADFRLDGKPRAQAKAEHSGVILSFTTKLGDLSYPCDTFTTWTDNLRAIALALEALRKVDRYGVTSHGEQYRGFLALEATAIPGGFATTDDALAFLGKFIGLGHAEMRLIAGAPSRALRRAQREAHPDTGGDAAMFQRVTLAEAKLREEGLL